MCETSTICPKGCCAGILCEKFVWNSGFVLRMLTRQNFNSNLRIFKRQIQNTKKKKCK